MSPDGTPRLWCNIGDSAEAEGVLEVIRAGRTLLPDLSVILTGPRAVRFPDPLPDRVEIVPRPYDLAQIVDRFLAEHRPDLALLTGSDLASPVVSACRKRDVPMVLVNARFRPRGALQERLSDIWMGGRLRAFAHVFAVEESDADYLLRRGAQPARVEVLGQLDPVPASPTCDEAERDYLAAGLAGRPVWLAAELPEAEIPAVEAAYREANRQAHRLLLVVTPVDPALGATFAEAFEHKGWITARREAGAEPDQTTQVYVADTIGEAGLWYRLAPITYLGGTLSSAPFPDPFGPAALGSAVLHGTALALPSPRLEALVTGSACRAVADAQDLGAAVGDLLAPDRNAQMAARAWDVTSRSAESALRVASVLADVMAEGAR